MVTAAAAAGIHRRTLIRLENDMGYARKQPDSLLRMLVVFRMNGILLDGDGLFITEAPSGKKHPNSLAKA